MSSVSTTPKRKGKYAAAVARKHADRMLSHKHVETLGPMRNLSGPGTVRVKRINILRDGGLRFDAGYENVFIHQRVYPAMVRKPACLSKYGRYLPELSPQNRKRVVFLPDSSTAVNFGAFLRGSWLEQGAEGVVTAEFIARRARIFAGLDLGLEGRLDTGMLVVPKAEVSVQQMCDA